MQAEETIKQVEQEKESLKNEADVLQHMVDTKQQELTDAEVRCRPSVPLPAYMCYRHPFAFRYLYIIRSMQALYQGSVLDKVRAEEHARAAETAKAVQESETRQFQLRISELETQAKVLDRSHQVSRGGPHSRSLTHL